MKKGQWQPSLAALTLLILPGVSRSVSFFCTLHGSKGAVNEEKDLAGLVVISANNCVP